MSHSSDSKDSPDEAIPLLTEVLVSGSPTRGHQVATPAAPADTFEDVPVLEDVFEAPAPKGSAPAHLHAEDEDVPVLDDVFEAPSPEAALDTPAPEAVEAPAVAAPPVTTTAAASAASAASTASAQPVASTEAPHAAAPDADALAEHLRGKFTAYLRGPGQEVIEERCRAAMQVHATWLVGQIAKEVGAVLEAQMSNWVREAVEEERRRQS